MTGRLCGSGVVCYARRRDGHVWLLLGRERETPGWTQGSRRWSSFSGRVEAGESALQNAAREFVEESCAAVALEEGGRVPVRTSDVERCLARASVVERGFVARGGEAARHVTFVARVPFADQPAQFARFRGQLMRLDAVFRALYRARKDCEAAPRLVFPGFEMSPRLVTQDLELDDVEEPPKLRVTLWSAWGRELVELQPTAPMLPELRRLRDALAVVRCCVAEPEAAAALAHPAVRVTRVGGVVAHARVDRAFLEKSELRWFEAVELEQARAEGRLADDFRRCFLEAMPDVLGRIADAERGDAAAV